MAVCGMYCSEERVARTSLSLILLLKDVNVGKDHLGGRGKRVREVQVGREAFCAAIRVGIPYPPTHPHLAQGSPMET